MQSFSHTPTSTSDTRINQLQNLANVVSEHSDALADVLENAGIPEQIQEFGATIYTSIGGLGMMVNQIIMIFKRAEALLLEAKKHKDNPELQPDLYTIANNFNTALINLKGSNNYIRKEFGREIDRLLGIIQEVLR